MNNIFLDENKRRRIISLALATSLTFTSFGLTGCTRTKGRYGTSEKASIYEEIEKGPEEWFCDIYVEDYNDKILEGAKFELKDENGTLIDSWISTKKAHRIMNLEEGIYTLTEVSTPSGYIITGNNTWEIDINSGWRHEIIAIKNILEKEHTSNNVNNILNTGVKENIIGEYFVLKIKESYDNRKSKRDHLEYKGELPKYILLRGTSSDIIIPEYSETIQYQFNDITSGHSFDNTNVVMTYIGDGYYSILLYKTYLGIKGKLSNDNLYIVPLSDLTQEELEELINELKDNQDMLDKLLSYDYTKPKTKTLTK